MAILDILTDIIVSPRPPGLTLLYWNRIYPQVFFLYQFATPFLEFIAITLDTQQGACSNHVEATVLFEELQ